MEEQNGPSAGWVKKLSRYYFGREKKEKRRDRLLPRWERNRSCRFLGWRRVLVSDLTVGGGKRARRNQETPCSKEKNRPPLRVREGGTELSPAAKNAGGTKSRGLPIAGREEGRICSPSRERRKRNCLTLTATSKKEGKKRDSP